MAHAQDDVPEPRWPVRIHSQHLACERCGRSFEPLTPHSFSFNSPLGWCASCEGLGVQVGANPAALLRDPKLNAGRRGRRPLAEPGASRVAADAGKRCRPAPACRSTRPFDQLGGRQRRLLMHGTGEQWFEVDRWLPTARRQPAFPQRRRRKLAAPLRLAASFPRSASNSRACTRRWKKPPGCRRRSARGWSSWSTKSNARRAAAAGCGTTPPRSGFAIGRSTNWAACRWAICCELVQGWKLTARERKIAGELLREITGRVQFLLDVGLEYLTLARSAATLSNGEAQRIRLASQLGSGLCGVLYVLDEPTIGLHPARQRRLLAALHKLRDLGNTLLVVEHDREVIAGSDYHLRFRSRRRQERRPDRRPRARPAQVAKRRGSVTGPYLGGKKAIPVPDQSPSGADADGQSWQRATRSRVAP